MSAFDTTSDFVAAANTLISDDFIRKFTIGNSDYTAYVKKWPRIKRQWNDIRPNDITISLANEEGTFNFYNDLKTNIVSSCSVQAGFTAAGCDTYFTMHAGQATKVKYVDGTLNLTIRDKIKPFSEIVLGDKETPLDYTGSDYLPSDIAWDLATIYGGLDATKSSANPDIDYDSFSIWAGVFSADNVLARAYFEGKKLTEAFRKIGRMTRSAISIENNKLTFARYDISSIQPLELPVGSVTKFSATIDDSLIVNQQKVSAGYNVDSDSFAYTVSNGSTASQNSYGLHENLLEDTNFWYVNSLSALNIAQRQITTNAGPYTKYDVGIGLQVLAKQLGETVTIADSLLGISGELQRVLGYSIDLDSGRSTIMCDNSQILQFFRLDVSTLDNTTAVLG